MADVVIKDFIIQLTAACRDTLERRQALSQQFNAQLSKLPAASKFPPVTEPYILHGTAFYVPERYPESVRKPIEQAPLVSIFTAIPVSRVLDMDRQFGTVTLPIVEGKVLPSGDFAGGDPRNYCAIDGTPEQVQYFNASTSPSSGAQTPCTGCRCPKKTP